MCDENGPCAAQIRMKQIEATVCKAIANYVTGGTQEAIDLINGAIDNDYTNGYLLCLALAKLSASVITKTHKSECGHEDCIEWNLRHEVEMPGGQMVTIDDLEPGKRFALRFVTAFVNDDSDMCGALYGALTEHDDDSLMAKGIGELFTATSSALAGAAKAEGILPPDIGI